MTEEKRLTFIPSWVRPGCSVCNATPTVVSIDEKGREWRSCLCGPCFFGEARMTDHKEWK